MNDRDLWTFVIIESTPMRRSWTLELAGSNVRAHFAAQRSGRGGHERHITVTFSVIPGERINDKSATAYAMAHRCRFMAQMFDTLGDLTQTGDGCDLAVSELSGASCSVEGDDALTSAAVFFGDDFAETAL
jgi:hypothetical protein